MTKLDKGTLYEVYICNYINNNNEHTIAYLWKDIPDYILYNAKLINDINDCRINREKCKNYIHDIGIDIIQINNITNKISFIQCKNYEGTLCIKDLAGYFAIMSQSEHYDKNGIIYTSNNKYSHNLMRVCKNKTHTFIHLPMDNNITISKNILVPYNYQLECLDKFNKFYENNNNGILQMPCGCGKTFTSFLISEKYEIIIIISPLKQHTEQNVINYKKYSKSEIKTLIVDSDGTRNIKYILSKITENKLIIGSTYKSCDIIIELLNNLNLDKIFIIIDEFHNLSYNNIYNVNDPINKIIKTNVKKLYMSATPKIYEIEETNYNIENLLGKIVYKMDFMYAIDNNLISNYEIYLPIHEDDNYEILVEQIKILNYDKILIKKILYYFESIKILGKLKTIIYFNNHDHIDIFIKCMNDINNYYNYNYTIDSIICTDTKNNRNKKLENFNNNDNISILCSVGILDECIDIPSCNSVYITYNCVSKIRIIQRISRSLRKYNNKIAKILIWCNDNLLENPIINAIKEIDNDIINKFKFINYNKIYSFEENIKINKFQKYNISIYNQKLNNNNITFENTNILTEQTTDKIKHFNNKLIENNNNISIIEYVKKINNLYYNIDNSDDLINMIGKDECCIHHNMLKKYGISTLNGTTNYIKKLLSQYDFVENTDYRLQQVSQSATHGGCTHKNEYYLHPRTFKFCLMRSLKTKNYAKYYLFLEDCIKYFNDYQNKMNEKYIIIYKNRIDDKIYC
uniref:Helicase ATP-binding domain-containing protein n=1 Tax=viral metagenome TaxID=1070528 RepID=A0A6C0H843_9ZZZZ